VAAPPDFDETEARVWTGPTPRGVAFLSIPRGSPRAGRLSSPPARFFSRFDVNPGRRDGRKRPSRSRDRQTMRGFRVYLMQGAQPQLLRPIPPHANHPFLGQRRTLSDRRGDCHNASLDGARPPFCSAGPTFHCKNRVCVWGMREMNITSHASSDGDQGRLELGRGHRIDRRRKHCPHGPTFRAVFL